MFAKFLFPFLLLLLFFPELCIAGATDGLTLWFFTLIPAFFPFLFLSNMMISCHVTESISKPLSHIFKPLFHVSTYGSYIIFMGFLCGYPMGAKLCGDFAREGYITKSEGDYLLTFCNNPSPMFLLGYIMTDCMIPPFSKGITLILLYTAPVITGILLRKLKFSPFYYKKEKKITSSHKNEFSFHIAETDSITPHIQSSMFQAFHTLLNLGGYVILFNILSSLALYFLKTYPVTNLTLAGLLEMTTGAMHIRNSGLPIVLINLLAPLCAVFSGFSILAQAKGMLAGSSLSFLPCLAGKMIQVVIYIVLYGAAYTIFSI